MANTIHINIALPNKVCIDKECVSVNMPTSKGYVTILPHHANIIGALEPGYLIITFEDGSQYRGLINNGVFQVVDNKLIILSDFFEKDDQVNINAIKAIEQKIAEYMKYEELFDRTSKSLNSFTKLITAKASKGSIKK